VALVTCLVVAGQRNASELNRHNLKNCRSAKADPEAAFLAWVYRLIDMHTARRDSLP